MKNNERKILDFLTAAERLKSVPRHCYTKDGVRENVAAHSWRMALWAVLLKPYYPDLDMDKVIEMCIIHDLGEAITGDIPTFLKTDKDRDVEDLKLREMLRLLPAELETDLNKLFDEMDAQESAEAKLYKVIDKLEAVHQHNESDIATWEDHEYDLQRRYGKKEASQFEMMKTFRELILEDTEEKIKEAENEEVTV